MKKCVTMKITMEERETIHRSRGDSMCGLEMTIEQCSNNPDIRSRIEKPHSCQYSRLASKNCPYITNSREILIIKELEAKERLFFGDIWDNPLDYDLKGDINNSVKCLENLIKEDESRIEYYTKTLKKKQLKVNMYKKKLESLNK